MSKTDRSLGPRYPAAPGYRGRLTLAAAARHLGINVGAMSDLAEQCPALEIYDDAGRPAFDVAELDEVARRYPHLLAARAIGRQARRGRQVDELALMLADIANCSVDPDDDDDTDGDVDDDATELEFE